MYTAVIFSIYLRHFLFQLPSFFGVLLQKLTSGHFLFDFPPTKINEESSRHTKNVLYPVVYVISFGIYFINIQAKTLLFLSAIVKPENLNQLMRVI